MLNPARDPSPHPAVSEFFASSPFRPAGGAAPEAREIVSRPPLPRPPRPPDGATMSTGEDGE
jgi:hypothetical protein